MLLTPSEVERVRGVAKSEGKVYFEALRRTVEKARGREMPVEPEGYRDK